MSFLQALRFGMRLIINKKILIGVPTIIKNSRGEILLGKRSMKVFTYPGMWGIPGGAIEYGETIEHTAQREIKEELGIDSEILGYGKPAAQLPTKKFKVHAMSIPVYCKIKGNPKPKDETLEVKWFKPEEIRKMKLAYNHKEILEREKVI